LEEKKKKGKAQVNRKELNLCPEEKASGKEKDFSVGKKEEVDGLDARGSVTSTVSRDTLGLASRDPREKLPCSKKKKKKEHPGLWEGKERPPLQKEKGKSACRVQRIGQREGGGGRDLTSPPNSSP